MHCGPGSANSHCADASDEFADHSGETNSPTLPGIGPYGDKLNKKITHMHKTRGKDYKPRTRHLQPDGSARYTNRLYLESSPYLLQHAHNPVNWYPWGDEAFAMAKNSIAPYF